MMTVNDILTTLTATPHLRSLRVHTANLGEVTPLLPSASLTNLSHLALFVDLAIGATLLDHLELPPSCAMLMYFRADVDALSEDLYRLYIQAVSGVAKNIYRRYRRRNLKLYCSRYGLTLSFTDETRLDKPCFSFHNMFKFD